MIATLHVGFSAYTFPLWFNTEIMVLTTCISVRQRRTYHESHRLGKSDVPRTHGLFVLQSSTVNGSIEVVLCGLSFRSSIAPFMYVRDVHVLENCVACVNTREIKFRHTAILMWECAVKDSIRWRRRNRNSDTLFDRVITLEKRFSTCKWQLFPYRHVSPLRRAKFCESQSF